MNSKTYTENEQVAGITCLRKIQARLLSLNARTLSYLPHDTEIVASLRAHINKDLTACARTSTKNLCIKEVGDGFSGSAGSATNYFCLTLPAIRRVLYGNSLYVFGYDDIQITLAAPLVGRNNRLLCAIKGAGWNVKITGTYNPTVIVRTHLTGGHLFNIDTSNVFTALTTVLNTIHESRLWYAEEHKNHPHTFPETRGDTVRYNKDLLVTKKVSTLTTAGVDVPAFLQELKNISENTNKETALDNEAPA